MDLNQIEKYRKLGLNVAYYRKYYGYTQLKLAELLEIDRTHVSNIELATSGVSLDIIFRISDLLNIPVEKFFTFRD